MRDGILVSYAIPTHNRCERLLETLGILEANTPLERGEWEVWVVDNACTDGTAEAVRRAFPDVHVIVNPLNGGTVAKNLIFDQANGKYVVMIDDDSYPVGDTITRAVDYLEAHEEVGGVVGRCVLPDGRCEAPALPNVMMGGASILRMSVLDEVGGFPEEFFLGAEECDLSFRMWDAGYAIARFEDVIFRHDKVMTGRVVGLLDFTDLRNNLILVERYLPRAMRRVYRRDWLRRYGALAKGDAKSIGPAVAEARVWAARERAKGRQVLKQKTLETIFHWEKQAKEVAAWAKANAVSRVAIDGYSKNLYATYRACYEAGLEVCAITDDAPLFVGEVYRGLDVVARCGLKQLGVDGVVVSNINPAQVGDCHAQVQSHFQGPTLRLWEGRLMEEKECGGLTNG